MHTSFFFFNDTATTEIYTLSLHDALPIYHGQRPRIELTRPLAMAEDHDQRVERQHPAPQDDRALQRSPHARDAIPERRAQGGIVRDVADGEIEGEERVDEEREAARDQREDGQRGV